MIIVKVFHEDPEGDDYKRLLGLVRKVAERFSGVLELKEVSSDSEEARDYGIVVFPTVVVNDTILPMGQPLSAGRLRKLIERELVAGR